MLKFILYVFVFYFLFRLLFRLFVVKAVRNSAGERGQESALYDKEEEITITSNQSNKKAGNDKEIGEYVDFEEIK